MGGFRLGWIAGCIIQRRLRHFEHLKSLCFSGTGFALLFSLSAMPGKRPLTLPSPLGRGNSFPRVFLSCLTLPCFGYSWLSDVFSFSLSWGRGEGEGPFSSADSLKAPFFKSVSWLKSEKLIPVLPTDSLEDPSFFAAIAPQSPRPRAASAACAFLRARDSSCKPPYRRPGGPLCCRPAHPKFPRAGSPVCPRRPTRPETRW